jgi:diadenylate cyclase
LAQLRQLLSFTILSVTIPNIIDIIIVAFVFYKLFMLIRETRAEQLIKGIVVLLIATKVSEWLGFWTINWILTNTLTVGVLALLIIFQPELRKALEKIGRGNFLKKSLTEEQRIRISEQISEICEAVANMAKGRIGALIVLERETGLSEVIETGTTIDGVVSSSLLENIFVPNTPLHDGAVIVRNFRIMAAGCFLPLTENQNLNKTLGTRHRAGLGITENSDAMAIIVSEETGVISMAINGRLSRYLDIKTLRSILNNAYMPPDNKQNYWWKWRGWHE